MGTIIVCAMRTPLRIAVAQPLTRSDDVEGNAARHADAVRAARPAWWSSRRCH